MQMGIRNKTKAGENLSTIISPAYTTPNRLALDLRAQGHAVLGPADMPNFAQRQPAELETLKNGWNDLPPDNYLRDGGRYRHRRHSCFVVEDSMLRQVPHRAHWQPLQYNALHGGMQRLFEPIKPETVQLPVWSHLLLAIGKVCSQVKPTHPWYVEAHQFRIDTADGIGRPTPEGAHRDGVDFVAILLVTRSHIKGGESRIFEADAPHGKRFTMLEPWTLLILDDQRVIHETTPIQPTASGGHRDTLVLTYRANGFQQQS